MNPNAAVRADLDRNCLYITLEGFFDLESAKGVADAVSKELGGLRRGFTVINDISRIKAASEEVIGQIEELIQLIERAGVSKVFRVVSQESTIAKIQHARLQREVGVDYEVIEVSSIEEANRLLHESSPSD